MNQKTKISKINIVFLVTVVVSVTSAYLPFGKITQNTLALLIISQLLLIIPSAVYIIKEKQNFAETIRLKPISVSTFFKLIFFTWCLSPVLNLINALSQLFTVNAIADTMTSAVETAPIAVALIVIALVPCIFEESVYRGIFYNEYRKVNTMKGILLSAFLFGILHGNLNQFTYAFFMGIIFALTIEATDSILSSMIMHFIINANSVLTIYAYPRLLNILRETYEKALQSGDTKLAQMIYNILGGENFTMNEVLENSSNYMQNLSVADILRVYGLDALTFGIAAFLIYKSIAKKEGQLDKIKAIFVKQKKPDDENEAEASDKKESLITIPLIIAISILIAVIISYEIMIREQ